MTCIHDGNVTICMAGPWEATRGLCLWCGKHTRQLVAPVHGGYSGFDHMCGECGSYWNDEGGVDLRPVFEDSGEGVARKKRMRQVAAFEARERPMSDIVRDVIAETIRER